MKSADNSFDKHRWAAGSGRGRTHEAKAGQIKFFNKVINDPNEMVFANPVLQPVRKKHRLTPVNPLDETRHPDLRYLAEVYQSTEFPHSLGRDQSAAEHSP